MALLTEEIQAIKCKGKVYSMGASFCIAKQQDLDLDSAQPPAKLGSPQAGGVQAVTGEQVQTELLPLVRGHRS